MTIVLRFAPSPTGLLHVGNARVALINWLFARAGDGRFILRLDDTDAERSREDFAQAIQEDLAWLGLAWDGLERQSARLDRYHAAFEALRAAGRIYPCHETPEELEYKRKRQLARHLPPVYDRAALSLSDADRAALEAEGRRPHWRFKLADGEIAWEDGVRGPVRFLAANLGDPVVVREDGTFLYMLPSVVDDIDMGITHVIRGEDHVANTAVQAQMFEALGGHVPYFAHLPLMTDLKGDGLSKRTGSLSLRELRGQGIEPMALNSYLAHLGTSDEIQPMPMLSELAAAFDLTHCGRASPKFDPDQLWRLNERLLHSLSFEAIRDRLGLEPLEPAFWEAIRPNLRRLSAAAVWHRVCHGDIDPVGDDGEFLATAADLLPAEPWGETTWKAWTNAVGAVTGRKGKELFMPLRLALTGLDHGPELKALLPLIGRNRAMARLKPKD